MQGERLNVDSSVTRKQCGQIDLIFFCNASERRVISMYMTNEEWEQNNQDHLKESYEETGFTAGGYFTMSTPKTAAGKRAIPILP